MRNGKRGNGEMEWQRISGKSVSTEQVCVPSLVPRPSVPLPIGKFLTGRGAEDLGTRLVCTH